MEFILVTGLLVLLLVGLIALCVGLGKLAGKFFGKLSIKE